MDRLKRHGLQERLVLATYKSPSSFGMIQGSKGNCYIVIEGDIMFSDTYYLNHSNDKSDTKIRPNASGGYPCLRGKLSIGNKYWNGSKWTLEESYFPIEFGDRDETSSINKHIWYSTLNNTDPNLELGKDGLCIPITPSDRLKGILTFSIYPISYYNDDESLYYTVNYINTENGFDQTDRFDEDPNKSIRYGDLVRNFDQFDVRYIYDQRSEEDGGDLKYAKYYTFYIDGAYGLKKAYSPYQLLRNLRLNFISLVGDFFDTQENKAEDIIYENVIDDEFVNDFDDLVLFVNTKNDSFNTPSSYSFVTNANGDYITSINGTSLRPEEQLIKKYADHYSMPRLIYSNTLSMGQITPYSWFSIDGLTLFAGSMEYDFRYSTINIKGHQL